MTIPRTLVVIVITAKNISRLNPTVTIQYLHHLHGRISVVSF